MLQKEKCFWTYFWHNFWGASSADMQASSAWGHAAYTAVQGLRVITTGRGVENSMKRQTGDMGKRTSALNQGRALHATETPPASTA